jgi:hypothetical protein
VSLASWGLGRHPGAGRTAARVACPVPTRLRLQSTAAARFGRTRDLPVTRDGQRAAAATVDEGALTTRLTGLTPARMLHDREFLLSPRSEKNPSEAALRASVGTVGDGEQACELTRRLGLDSRCVSSQAEPSSTGGHVICRRRAADPEAVVGRLRNQPRD